MNKQDQIFEAIADYDKKSRAYNADCNTRFPGQRFEDAKRKRLKLAVKKASAKLVELLTNNKTKR